MPQKSTIIVEANVGVPMRDGVTLYADIHRPGDSSRHPAILVRLPYAKDAKFESGDGRYLTPQRYVKAGYAVVIQDCRGTGVSEGEFYPFLADPQDGYDTVEWAAVQPWCDGNVGMMGSSALGGTQWATATARPPHLKTICPQACFSSARRGQFIRDSGVLRLNNLLYWYLQFCAGGLRTSALSPERRRVMRQEITAMLDNFEEQCRLLPVSSHPATQLSTEVGVPPFLSDWLSHIEDDPYWAPYWSADDPIAKVDVPALHICGWNEDNASGVLSSYLEMRDHAGSELARENQKLLMGPWVHVGHGSVIGDLNYGLAAAGTAVDVMGLHIRWFDYWLKGIDNGIMSEPRVKIFVMGENVWRDENEWPLARTRYTPYYFHSGGSANCRSGDGTLSCEHPQHEQPDVYLYDPRNPTPTRGGMDNPAIRVIEVQEQKVVEQRADVLVYTSAPLDTDLEVTGPITIKLWAASSAVDTDFTGKLTDVWPSGKSYNLVDGIVRARYREGVSQGKYIQPGRVYEYSVDLRATSNVFKAGHRIRVQVSSSNFPKHDRNQNTGHPIGQDTELQVAVQTIYHDELYPSHIILPIIPR